MTPVARPEALRRRLGPERVAVIVALVIALAGLAVASTMGSTDGVTPGPSLGPGEVEPVATPHPFATTATLTLLIHERLAEDRAALATALADADLDTPAVVVIVRRLNSTSNIGSDMATSLAGIQGSREVGRALGAFYESVAEAADVVLGTQVRDEVAYRAAAERLLAALEPTAALQQRLEDLIASALATPTPPTVRSATPTASEFRPSPTPSKTPPATPTPVAPTPTPTPVPTPLEPSVQPTGVPLVGLVQNPGFEAADPSPWVLLLESPAAATLTLDTATPYEGRQSARIDISAPSDARAGISLRQTRIEVAQGHRYACRVALRAAALREVRVRVTSASGATYGTRLLTVGPDWTVVEFEFGSFVGDPAAVFEIDLGLSATTTWVDAAQITDVTGLAP